jgi:hypothetical protein
MSMPRDGRLGNDDYDGGGITGAQRRMVAKNWGRKLAGGMGNDGDEMIFAQQAAGFVHERG